jgi:hypothetical protein
MHACYMTRLAVVLLNPVPHDRPTVTARNVELAQRVLGYERITRVNLSPVPAPDLAALSLCAAAPDSWRAHRPMLRQALWSCDALLFAWGVTYPTGAARAWAQEQLAYVHGQARLAGHTEAFLLDGRPRHPSRWQQYLGPQRGLVEQVAFDERVRRALKRAPILRPGSAPYWPPSGRRLGPDSDPLGHREGTMTGPTS